MFHDAECLSAPDTATSDVRVSTEEWEKAMRWDDFFSRRRHIKRRRRQQEIWNYLGAVDPDWAVLTEPDRRNHGWDRDLDEFYSSGGKVVDEMLAVIPGPSEHGRALDWGTGTGRLAFALASKFDEVVAVDIAEPMLRIARHRMRERGIGNIRFCHADEYHPDGDCDLVISQFVLQHLSSASEVVEVLQTLAQSLAPAGWMIIELPARSVDLRGRLQIKARAHRLLHAMYVPLPVLKTLQLSGIGSLTISPWMVTTALRQHSLITYAWLDRSTGFDYVRYAAQAPEHPTHPIPS
jgi:SAM-dependent methyltransferase